MNEPNYEIFISYSRKDRVLVKKLLKALHERGGWKIFLDEAIEPGERWDSKLESMLERVLCVLVVWTLNSYNSEWVRNEASVAKSAEKYFPVLLGDVEQQPLEFQKRQVLKLGDWKGDPETDEFEELSKRLDRFIEKRRPQGFAPKEQALDPLDQVLAKTVDRVEQIAELESTEDAGEVPGPYQCWMFHCRTDDWPDALADHFKIHKLRLLDRDSGVSLADSETTKVQMVGANAIAFRDALAQQLPSYVVQEKLDLETWLSQEPHHKVIYLSLDLSKDKHTNAKLLAIKGFLDELPLVKGAKVTVLVACFLSDFRWIKKRVIDWTTKRLTQKGVLRLPPLGLIGDEQAEQWVDGFLPAIRTRYDTGWIKQRLWERLQEGKQEPYRKIQKYIEDTLKQARLRRKKAV